MKRFLRDQPLLLKSWGFSFLILFFGLLLAGCTGSSPRFAGHEKKEETQTKHRKGNVRFSSKESEEERKEDDKKVDVKKAEQRFSSSSPVTKEASPSPAAKKSSSAAASTEPVTAKNFEQQKMMDAILAWMGTPYEHGGNSKSGIDCSGFTQQIFKESASMDLPRTTETQIKLGTPISQDELKFGDLIFFNTTGQNPSHVGIYIGDDMFAHASVSFGVTLSSLYSSYYKKRYTEARRVIK
jgi:cell wall-associated NlpC family hydrolase